MAEPPRGRQQSGGSAESLPGQQSGERCERCGGQNPTGRRYCMGCGGTLASAKRSERADPTERVARDHAPSPPPPVPEPLGLGARICHSCQSPIDLGARFCKFCGSALVAAPAVGPTKESAVPRAGEESSGSLSAQVVVILRDGTEGGVYRLNRTHTDVGSREGDIVLPDDPYLAARHARIERRGDTFVLLDLGSINGIYVRVRQPTPLADADMLLIGQQVLRFEVTSEAERQVGPATQHGVRVFGTPEAPRLARLVQYTTEGLARDVYYLHREETVLGREQADVVFSDDPFLSRRHASVTLQDDRFVLRDLGSSNGTAIRCRSDKVLTHGDQFRLGRHLFRFDLSQGGRSGQ